MTWGMDPAYERQLREQREQVSLRDVAQTNLAETAAEQAKYNLQQQKEAWRMKKNQASSGGAVAAQFLSNWSTSINRVGNMFEGASNLITNLIKGGKGKGKGRGPLKSSIPGFDSVLKQMKDSYSNYKENFAPAAEDFIKRAQEEGKQRGEAISQLQESAKADYEGVRERAAGDVATQGALSREAQARQLQAAGVDPTSGKFGALSRKSFMDQAKSSAIAQTMASRGEKERSAGATAQLASLIDPSRTAATGIGIANLGNQMLGQQGQMVGLSQQSENERLRTQASLANTLGGLAQGYSQAVVQPQGEMAGYFLGQGGGALPGPGGGFSGARPANNGGGGGF